MKVTILSAPSGTGKSTWAKKQRDAVICSADDYFLGPDGSYNFDPLKLGKAHAWCLHRFLFYLEQEYKHVIVDNTNLSIEEMAPYYALAEAFGYTPTILRGTNMDTSILMKQNIHGVPPSTIQIQQERHMNLRMPLRWNWLYFPFRSAPEEKDNASNMTEKQRRYEELMNETPGTKINCKGLYYIKLDDKDGRYVRLKDGKIIHFSELAE